MNEPVKSLGEAFPEELARVGELLGQYAALGPAGTFGAMVIRQVLTRATKAAGSGDVIAMARCYEELKGCS